MPCIFLLKSGDSTWDISPSFTNTVHILAQVITIKSLKASFASADRNNWFSSNIYGTFYLFISLPCSVQFSSVAQSCPTLCDPMNHSTPGLPVHNKLPEFTQTHAHRVGDAIQPSYPLSSPSPPAPNPSQHQGLFQWVNSSVDNL